MKPILDSFTEPQIDRRKVLLGLLFCSSAGIAAWRRPTKHLDYLGRDKLGDIVPTTIGQWNFVAQSGLVVPPEDQLSRALYSQLLTRVYSDGESPPIMLLMAQSGSQTGVLQIHRPETCYTASGRQISTVVPQPVRVGSKIIPANAMAATADGLTEHVLYWTRVGDKMPGSWKVQRLVTAEQNLRGIIPDAILVRVSTIRNDADGAWAALESFIRHLIESVPASRRAVFIA
ncbi:MAG: exosortase-associated protein EpsI, V-type [Sphingomicrobium sp.]